MHQLAPDSVSAYATLLACADDAKTHSGYRKRSIDGAFDVTPITAGPGAETNFPSVGKLLLLQRRPKEVCYDRTHVTNMMDMGSTLRSFHGNCESQPVKQSR